jgi:hypothetical protein
MDQGSVGGDSPPLARQSQDSPARTFSPANHHGRHARRGVAHSLIRPAALERVDDSLPHRLGVDSHVGVQVGSRESARAVRELHDPVLIVAKELDNESSPRSLRA